MSQRGIGVRVTPYGSAWAVRWVDSAAPIMVYADLSEARAYARELARNSASELIVYNERWEHASYDDYRETAVDGEGLGES